MDYEIWSNKVYTFLPWEIEAIYKKKKLKKCKFTKMEKKNFYNSFI